MPIKYVGREGVFHGKTLFEIARNLKYFGKGRIVVRQEFLKRYPNDGPSFYKLISVRPEMNVDVTKGYGAGTAYGYKVWKGQYIGKCQINAGAKQDWQLIPRDEEHYYKFPAQKTDETEQTVVSTHFKVPPMMEIVFKEELKAEGMQYDESKFLCKRKIQQTKFNISCKLDGETITSRMSELTNASSSTGV